MVNKPNVEELMVVSLPYSVDPEKDEAWVARTKPKYSNEDWQREFGLKPAGHKDVYPVFGDWRKELHERKDLRFDPALQLYLGWDFGKVHPCVELFQVRGAHLDFIDEFYGNNIYLNQVCLEINLRLGQMGHPINTSWVDATGKNDNFEGRNHIKVLKENGFTNVKFRYQDIEPGIAIMQRLINTFADGRPCLCVNPDRCPHLCEAMRGGYKRDKRGTPIKDGTFDHPVDACRYGVVGVSFGLENKMDLQMAKAKAYRFKPRNPWTGYALLLPTLPLIYQIASHVLKGLI